MYCPKCGKIVDEEVKFCPYCGKSLVKSENKTSNTSFTNANFTNNVNNNSTTTKKKEKGRSGAKICCYVFIVLLIVFMAAYVIDYNIDRENVFSFNDLDALDIDGDGYLTFDEAKEYGNTTPESKLLEFFNQADHNKNNLLKGDEFDTFTYSVDKYEHPEVKKSKPSTSNSNSKSSSSSSKSSSDYRSRTSPEYELWEEEEIVEYDEYGKPVYVCVYYTSGDKYFDPGVYTAIGNDYSGWDYEYEGSNWRAMFN